MDQYVSEVRKLSQNYGFHHLKESLIQGRIIWGIRGNVLREKLLHVGDTSLGKAFQICRALRSSEGTGQRSEASHYASWELERSLLPGENDGQISFPGNSVYQLPWDSIGRENRSYFLFPNLCRHETCYWGLQFPSSLLCLPNVYQYRPEIR